MGMTVVLKVNLVKTYIITNQFRKRKQVLANYIYKGWGIENFIRLAQYWVKSKKIINVNNDKISKRTTCCSNFMC